MHKHFVFPGKEVKYKNKEKGHFMNFNSRQLMVLLFLFLVGSLGGYGLEVLFRRFFSAKRWVNPGFMKGPWLPLYGFGIVIMFIACSLFFTYLPSSMPLYNPNGNLFNKQEVSLATVYDLIPIVTIWISLILLELIAGLIFVKGFKVRLWDYTNMKGNLFGVICPVFSVIWLAVTVLYYYCLNPWVYDLFQEMFAYLFEGGDAGIAVNFVFIFFMGIVYGFFIYDLVISIGLFPKISKMAKETGIIGQYEYLRKEVQTRYLKSKAEILSFVPQDIREKAEERKKHHFEFLHKIHAFFAKLILIDPNLTSKQNYDSSGRPKKIDE